LKAKHLTLPAVILFAGALHSQNLRGVIAGHVTDAAKKPLAGLTVSLIHEETNKQRSAVTSSEGVYAVPSLAPGPYRIEVEAPGRRKHAQTLVLEVNQEVRLDIPLLDANQREEVTVIGVRPLLRADSMSVGSAMDGRQIAGLPLDGRNFSQLGLLVPGAAPNAQGSAGSVRGDFAFSVNGSREDSNAFLLDGVYNGDPKLNTVGVTPPVDAVREFEVLTSTYDASFGRAAGAQMNVVLKSGGNRLHGTAYQFFRNRALDARNYFAPAAENKPQNVRNQFGGSLGGPVRKDRTFFFADYEGRRVREGITRTTNVPTALERVGDFSRSSVFAIDLFTQAPFPGNVIPRNRQSPIGAAIAALYPLPNRATPGRNFVSSPSLRDAEDHFDVRLDHAVSRGGDLSVRYSFADRDLYEPFSGAGFSLVPGYGTNVPRRAQNVAISETHALTPALLNEFRAGFNRVANGSFQENQSRNLSRAVGLPSNASNPRDFGLPLISLTGYSPIGDEYNNPQHGVTNVYQLVDQVTLVKGRHLVRAGGDFRLLQQNAYRDVLSRGFISFLGFTGNSLAEMLTDFPSVTGAAKIDNPQHLRSRAGSLFVQDTWRMRPDLTLTAGLRYELNGPPRDATDRANLFDRATGTLVPVGTKGMPRGGYEIDRNNFGPRFGLAWNPRGANRRVLRAGYGVYYDQSSLATGEGLYFSPPYFENKLFFTIPGLPPISLADPFPRFFPLPTPSSALAVQRDLRTAYIQQWSLNVQEQLGKSRVLEVGYVGSKGTGLLNARDINQPRPSPNPRNPRPLPQFDDISLLESRGSSIYHSLQARFQQRLSSGLSMLSSYTWSKSIDDASDFFPSAGDPNFPQDSYNVRAERGRSNFDVRQRLSVSYSYDLPLGKSKLLSGWQTFGILTFQSGRPFTVALLSDFDNSNTGRSTLGFGANDRPHLTGNPRLASRSPERWFNGGAFTVPPSGTFGNAGRNILDGPASHTVNASLIKNTAIAEGASLQLRLEAFNLLDRANFDLPDIFVGSPSFGRILSAGSPRRLQFGLKLLF
jgi:hypothetical protein